MTLICDLHDQVCFNTVYTNHRVKKPGGAERLKVMLF